MNTPFIIGFNNNNEPVILGKEGRLFATFHHECVDEKDAWANAACDLKCRELAAMKETNAATAALIVAGLLVGLAIGFMVMGWTGAAVCSAIVSVIATAVAYLLMACPYIEENDPIHIDVEA